MEMLVTTGIGVSGGILMLAKWVVADLILWFED